jgi:hypothetical protein
MGLRIAVCCLLLSCFLPAQRFLPDDPLDKEPEPLSAGKLARRKINDQYDFISHTFALPGEKSRPVNPIRAQAVNTLGEPLDGAWFTKRHYYKRMTAEELRRGPGGITPPAAGTWTVISAKSDGITPGFTILDVNKRTFFIKFDPPGYAEMATGAEMVAIRFYHALGYHVADTYLVRLERTQLQLAKDVRFTDTKGRTRLMMDKDLDRLLAQAESGKDGRYRAIASLALQGRNIGPFRYFGVRADDPNDTVPHEHRRDVRALGVFGAWLDHDDSRSINTFDGLVEENGRTFVRHYVLDFGSTLGSASTKPNSPRSGGEYLFDWKPVGLQFATFGMYVPKWARTKYPDYRSIGPYEAKEFDPEEWVPEYPNPAFLNRLPDDEFWAAKHVMAFTDDDVRAIVETAEYSDKAAKEYLVQTIIARRDKVGRAMLPKVLPLDRFRVENGHLLFDDLIQAHDFGKPAPLEIAWSRFDNESEKKTSLADARGAALPAEALQPGPLRYYAADVTTPGSSKSITVYVRTGGADHKVVGIDRRW